MTNQTHDTGLDLLPDTVRAALPPLYALDGVDAAEVPVIVKYFSPYSNWTWYATEGEPVLNEDGNEVDFRFFGYVVGHFPELGYFHLSELTEVYVKFAPGATGQLRVQTVDAGTPGAAQAVERDVYFSSKMLAEVMDGAR